jgi:hypothetical protein
MSLSPTILGSGIVWQVVNSALSIDVIFQVMSEVNWTRQKRQRKGSLVCSGLPITTSRGSGPFQIRLDVIVPKGTNRNSVVAALNTIWENDTATYILTQPGRSAVNAKVDGDVQWGDRMLGGNRVVSIGFYQVP